jgi:hypothetical protein
LFDRDTDSLWSQIKAEAVTGPMTGEKLKTIPSKVTTWKRWRKLHPESLVLSTDTGHSRDYSLDPYRDYFRSPFAFLGFRGKSPGLAEKELVLGVEINGQKKAYPLALHNSTQRPINDIVGGRAISVFIDNGLTGSGPTEAYVTEKDGTALPSVVTYWFVWYGFHPETKIYNKID